MRASLPPTRRILVIDDSELVREAARIALCDLGGYEVMTASCGRDGLARAAEERPDAIVLDVVMDGMDGMDTARRLAAAQATARIPIVLMTARADAADRERYASLPVCGVVGKPFGVARLASEVAGILGWSE